VAGHAQNCPATFDGYRERRRGAPILAYWAKISAHLKGPTLRCLEKDWRAWAYDEDARLDAELESIAKELRP